MIFYKSRRSFLTQSITAIGGLYFLGCGQGGGSSPGGNETQTTAGSSGKKGLLVYRNTSVAAIHNIESNTYFEFDPGVPPTGGIGIFASRSGKIVTLHEGDKNGNEFFVAIYDTQGKLNEKIGITRTLSFADSAVVFSPDETKIAFTINEEASAANSTRVSRTLIVELSSGRVLAELDDKVDPIFCDSTGDLFVRDTDQGTVRIYDSGFDDKGKVPSLDVTQRISSFTVSPDGRYIAWEDGRTIKAFDRNTSKQWTAAEDKLSAVYAPVFSPDGNWLAMHGRRMVTMNPHLVPFVPDTTTILNSEVHGLDSPIVETIGRMAWIPSHSI